MGFQLLKHIQELLPVDVIVAIGGFCCLMLNPLKNEYVYMKVAEAHNTTKSVISDCNENETSSIDILVQQEVSKWTLLLDLTMFIPASLTAILVTSWSDRVGRKITMSIPVAGMAVSSAFFAVSIYFSWPLKSLFLYNFVAGISGYYMTLLMQGNAYLSDITPSEKRGLRFVILETALGVGGGVGGISSGYWVKAQGFFVPVACTAGLSFVSLLLIPLLLDSRKIRDEKIAEKQNQEINGNESDHDYDVKKGFSNSYGSASSSSQHGDWVNNNEGFEVLQDHKKYTAVDVLKAVWKVYSSDYSHCVKCHGPIEDEYKKIKSYSDRCVHGGGRYPGRVWRMWFYLFAYDFNMFVLVGGMAFQTIYFLSKPLCFTPVLVGAQLGLRFAMTAFSPLMVWVYQKVFRMGSHVIIVVSLSALAASEVTMSFATTKAIVFIATSLLLFANPSKPFIQAQIANLVSESEHGAAFALLSFTEILSFLVATVSFLLLYSETVKMYRGFVWLFAAVVVLIPLCLMMTVMISDRRRRLLVEEEKRRLLSNVAS
ncbi:lysosomal proton-coupled steroid conjugate and bile acid symporter SLC46A3-like isoform X1 [Clavelina lepadiformis]|uniref:lysosomal proton-coupled steroid conjugate and bile acid symporter SLC46A3-like isoform X1 n=2 Tax=Clavelina lepadiformis TaxID=159417 RepID=UPI0040415665